MAHLTSAVYYFSRPHPESISFLLKHVSILPWKYRRGCRQGNKQLYSKTLAKNKSWRARGWRVWLTRNAWFLNWDCKHWFTTEIIALRLWIIFQCCFESFILFNKPPKQVIFQSMPWIVLWRICWTKKLGVIRLVEWFQWAIHGAVEERDYSKSIFWQYSAYGYFSHNLASFATIS